MTKTKLEVEFFNEILKNSELILDERQINNLIANLAEQITRDFYDKMPLVLVVMRGGMFGANEILNRLTFPLQVDYLEASRYGDALSGKQLHWRVEPKADVKDRDILVIDDIFDQGITLKDIIDFLHYKQAKSVKSCVLIVKDLAQREIKKFQPDYIGATLPDKFLFGCGMDVKNYWRNLKQIYALPDAYIQKLGG